MQEEGPEAADLALTDLQQSGPGFPAASCRCYMVPVSAHSQQRRQRSGPPDTASAGQARLLSPEACSNIRHASSRKLNHNTSRGRRLLKMQISRNPAWEAGCCRQGLAEEKHLCHCLSLPLLPKHSSKVTRLISNANHQIETKCFASKTLTKCYSTAFCSANVTSFSLTANTQSSLPLPCLRGRFYVSKVPYF